MCRLRASTILGVLLVCTLVQAAEEPRLVKVLTLQAGENLVCRLQTRGLPGVKQLQTMRSGLESAVDLHLALVDEDDRPVVRTSLSLRMSFDLWDEIFSVKEDGRERRFQTLADLESYLAELENIPLGITEQLESETRYRVRVGWEVHTIAPAEQKRVEDVIVGGQRPRREGQDQQETSVSLGRLIRFFYKSESSQGDDQGLVSSWFTRKDLDHAAD